MKKFIFSITLITSIFLSSCASVTRGTHQSLSVTTTPVSRAHCSLQNNKGQWYIPMTPGSVVVNKSFGDLVINCQNHKSKGHMRVKSKTHPAVLGNIIIGGAIGAAADAIDGAAYDYPNQVNIPLKS